MYAGEPFLRPDPELDALQDAARIRIKAFNETPESDFPARLAALAELFGRPVDCLIRSPFLVDYGCNIRIGRSFVNMNCVFLDGNFITIGTGVMIGTGVQLLAVGHPVHPSDRLIPWPDDPGFPFRGFNLAAPITIHDECWIGAGAIVIGGVTIGRGTTIGAGSVVTKSIPPFVVAAGNPGRVIRELERRPTFFHPDPDDP
jgi:acetyltransferase-like isoleucine patch superfamily enzyme